MTVQTADPAAPARADVGPSSDTLTAVEAKGLTLREKEVAALVTSAFIGCVH